MKRLLSFKVFLIALLCFSFITITNGAKILSVFGYPVPSQYVIASALLKELAKRGHDITSVSFFPQNTPYGNFQDVILFKGLSYFFRDAENETVNIYQEISISKKLFDAGQLMVTNVLEEPAVIKLMENEKFDLVIVETMVCEALYGLGQHFNASLIGLSTFGTNNYVDALVNNISPTSYIPHYALHYDNTMNLQERMFNLIKSFSDDVYYYFANLRPQQKLFKKYFPSSSLSFNEARKSFSLVLLNQHFSLSYPRPYVPNMIEVAGLHIPSQPEPLPEDLEYLLGNATEGAIYFSMDINLKKKELFDKTLQILFDAFRELNRTVLLKFENVYLPNKPPNVFLQPWYPQHSVLAHPNVKLFITHGSLLSITETIYYSKPFLAIPISGDQEKNVRKAISAGIGLSLELNSITKTTFKSKIYEILKSAHYTKRAKQMSKLFKDKPLTPMKSAIFWIEYVLRHKGAILLRNVGANLSYWEKTNADVYAILIAFCLMVLAVISR